MTVCRFDLWGCVTVVT